MKTLSKSMILLLALLLSGCYVQPWGFRHGGVYNNGYNGYSGVYFNNGYRNNGYFNNGYRNNGYFSNVFPYRPGYQNSYPRYNRGWGDHHFNNNNGYRGYNSGRQHFGHHGWHRH